MVDLPWADLSEVTTIPFVPPDDLRELHGEKMEWQDCEDDNPVDVQPGLFSPCDHFVQLLIGIV